MKFQFVNLPNDDKPTNKMDIIGFNKLVAELDEIKEREEHQKKLNSTNQHQNHIDFRNRKLRDNEDLGYFIFVVVEYANRCDFGDQKDLIIYNKIIPYIPDKELRTNLYKERYNTHKCWNLIYDFLDSYYRN